MRRFCSPLLFALCLLAISPSAPASQQPAPPATSRAPAATESKTGPGEKSGEAHYVLTPEKRAKAIAFSRAEYRLYFLAIALALALYTFLWRSGFAAGLRNRIRRFSTRRWVQAALFVAIFVVVVRAFESPLDYYWGFVLEHRYGLSTQGIESWVADWAKDLGLTVVVGILLAWVFYWVVRRSPRRWWLYFWFASIPITLAFIVVEPYVVEPLFYRFTPLEKAQPALTDRIEKMLGHAGLEIPRSRIYEMDASAKTRIVNAYVSGWGSSKRLVVWDTTLEKLNSDQTLLVVGHEAGHYVLHHIPKEFALDEMIFLVLFYAGYLAINKVMALTCHSERSEESRTVARLQSEILRSAQNDRIRDVDDRIRDVDDRIRDVDDRIRDVDDRIKDVDNRIQDVADLASLPIILIILTVVVFLASPALNGISRHYEHQADQFGLEVAYGVVSDPNTADVQSFQIMAEEDLEDPDPSPFIRFWLYTHPSTEERIHFAATYKPWAEGKPLVLIRR